MNDKERKWIREQLLDLITEHDRAKSGDQPDLILFDCPNCEHKTVGTRVNCFVMANSTGFSPYEEGTPLPTLLCLVCGKEYQQSKPVCVEGISSE